MPGFRQLSSVWPDSTGKNLSGQCPFHDPKLSAIKAWRQSVGAFTAFLLGAGSRLTVGTKSVPFEVLRELAR
jgi:hypothetical protein